MTTRILLRSRPNASFVSGGLDWSPFAAHADVFPNARAANEFVRSHGLKGMEIVVLRESGPPLRVPVDRISARSNLFMS
jgi:hypothetical protein